MQENREITDSNENLTDGEVMRAIRYLDPDLCADEAGENTGTAVGIGITLLSALTSTLTYIGLYVQDL